MKFSGRTVTAIIEFPNGKILLVKRGTIVFKGYWALPGGKVNADETIEHAVLREVKEETGLEVKIVRKVGEYQEAGFQDGREYDYDAACFQVRPTGGNIKKQEREIKEIKLFSIRDLPEKLAFEHSSMLRDYFKLSKLK